MTTPDTCDWRSARRCGKPTAVGYLGRGVCGKRWCMYWFMEGRGAGDAARAHLGLPAAEPVKRFVEDKR